MIRSETDLQKKFEYITRNPWDAGIASATEDYEWIWYRRSASVPRAVSDTLSNTSKEAPQNAELSAQNVRATRDALLRAKKLGFSDRQLAVATDTPEKNVRSQRIAQKITPTYRLVDTCAAEFEAYTPYYYSTYGSENERRESGKRKIMILGGGPNRVGQGIEFDYCCVHAAFALREIGFETIMVNSNPETVSTDYDTSDKLYFEPLTLEDVLNIYDQADRKSTRLNSSHLGISYAVFCWKKKSGSARQSAEDASGRRHRSRQQSRRVPLQPASAEAKGHADHRPRAPPLQETRPSSSPRPP